MWYDHVLLNLMYAISVKLTWLKRIKKVQQKAPRIQFTLVKNVKEFNHFASNSIVTIIPRRTSTPSRPSRRSAVDWNRKPSPGYLVNTSALLIFFLLWPLFYPNCSFPDLCSIQTLRLTLHALSPPMMDGQILSRRLPRDSSGRSRVLKSEIAAKQHLLVRLVDSITKHSGRENHYYGQLLPPTWTSWSRSSR